MSHKSRRSVLVGATLLVLASTASALEPTDMPDGRKLYVRLCASCHGPGGRGDGPVAGALGEPPTDLTSLARRHDGEFSAIDVFSAVDGTTMPRAHGVSEMPVWGEILRKAPGMPDDQATEAARDALLAITDYLRTIQRP
jgi:mono/diheme cytochrome c family protein